MTISVKVTSLVMTWKFQIPFLSQFETLSKVLHLICCPRDCCFSFLPPPLPLSSSSFFFYLLTMLNLKLNCYQMVEFKCGLHCTVCKCYRTFSFVIKNIKNLITPELILIKIELIFKFICRQIDFEILNQDLTALKIGFLLILTELKTM